MKGALVRLGQAKVLDLVEHDYWFAVLRAFGLLQCWVDLLHDLYIGLSSALTFNVFLSPDFPVTCGVQQGCPLLPFLF